MNTGKIITGFSLVLLSIAMMVSPSGAIGTDEPCAVGCGIAPYLEEAGGPIEMHPGPTALFIFNELYTQATNPYER